MDEIISYIFGGLGVVGTVFSIYTYLRQRKKLFYVLKNKKIISAGDVVSSMKVLYNDKIVENLSITTIVCWNGSPTRITKGDFNNKNAIYIFRSSESVEILGIQREAEYKENYVGLKINKNKEENKILSLSLSFNGPNAHTAASPYQIQ